MKKQVTYEIEATDDVYESLADDAVAVLVAAREYRATYLPKQFKTPDEAWQHMVKELSAVGCRHMLSKIRVIKVVKGPLE